MPPYLTSSLLVNNNIPSKKEEEYVSPGRARGLLMINYAGFNEVFLSSGIARWW
jgi:hypothetical protein